jgi:hypothetical protein
MNFRINRLPLYQAPDTPVEPTENALQAELVIEQVTETPVEAVVEEPVVETPVETPEAEDKRKNPWFLKRISETTERARLAEERAAAAEALAERLQKGTETLPAPPLTNERDIEALVEARAARKLFDADCNHAASVWKAAAGDAFESRIGILSHVGLLPNKDGSNTEFLMDVFAVDKENAHQILDTLAQDPEQATALAAMDSRRRTAALTRLSMATNTAPVTAPKTVPAAKQVSRAPAPAPQVEPSASKVVDWRKDDSDDATFDVGFREMMLKRNKAR